MCQEHGARCAMALFPCRRARPGVGCGEPFRLMAKEARMDHPAKRAITFLEEFEAFAVYVFIVRFLGWVIRSKEAAPLPPLTKDQELLTEIRDLLKAKPAP